MAAGVALSLLAVLSAPVSAQDAGAPPAAVAPPAPPVVVVDPPAPPLPPAGPNASRAAAAAPFDYSQTFLLHSLPGSQRTIYLDFKGGTVTGTAWNGTYGTGATINAAPYSLDADPAFSNAEMDAVQAVWQRVSEDYAPFDVDVTTEAPAAATLDRTNAADQVYGTTAMITNTNFPSCTCGGIAYTGAFEFYGSGTQTHTYYQPAWVFVNHLSSDTKNIAEAASHEVGHNLGLSHDGVTTVAGDNYYSGAGAWAPIMGAGYSEPLTQFSKGEYKNANNTEDDLALITDTNPSTPAGGVNYKADDVGDTTSTATPLSGTAVGSTTTFGAAGIISTTADKDVYSVTVGAGGLSFSASPAPVGPNLDIKLTLQSATSTLAVADPPSVFVNRDAVTGLDASLSVTGLPAGTYYVTVDGVGSGDPMVDGYTDYASLGRYTLSGTFTPAPPAKVVGDFTGDGKTDVAVYRPSNSRWYVNGQPSVAFGVSGDIPVPGDYNGDGKTDIAVFRPSDGHWYINGQPTVALGLSGDIPVPGDYNGDGKTDAAVFRPSDHHWYINGQPTVSYGMSGDIPEPGDYNGDGKTDAAIFRPSNGRWYINGQPYVAYGISGDIPLVLPYAIRLAYFP